MAFDPKKYPPYWKQFSQYIRFERAGNKCEKCGIENGRYKVFGFNGELEIVDAFEVLEVDFLVKRFSKVVLTVAHLDRWNDICQCKKFFGFKCAKPKHVLALCQSCHLNYDRPLHLAVQAKNRAVKKDLARPLFNV